MIAIKTSMFDLPEYCDSCRYYQCSPHPTKGWSDVCGLCYECMDDECKEGWFYDGNSRPEKCPLFIVPEDRTCSPVEPFDSKTKHIVERGSNHCYWPYKGCSECQCDFPQGSNYCPNCGAKVVSE